jgi:phosphoribosylamine--glycine ligase
MTDILVVGGGGREHAIIKALAASKRAGKLYCAPGNAGIAELAECIPVKATDIDGIVAAAKEKRVGLVFVAPDDPLVLGAVDALEAVGIRAFGPNARAAVIEGSKVFSKNLMKKYGIPTASYETFADPAAAREYIFGRGEYPVVVKAEGLALGKGVIIAQNRDEADAAIASIMEQRAFGDAGASVVVEEFLRGREVTVLAFTDGETVVPMVSSQDHKRAFDGDRGLNTGGMGAYSPSPVYTPEVARRCTDEIFLPTIAAMRAEGRPFKGVIYFGLMITAEGPKVIEYNARFGDPEAEVVLPRLKTDLLDIVDACIDGTLSQLPVEWSDDVSACVVLASGGYPVKYEKGKVISGVDRAGALDGVYVYHAGTATEGGELVTNGGRVLDVTATAPTMREALARAYEAAALISFDGMFYRRDIGRDSETI